MPEKKIGGREIFQLESDHLPWREVHKMSEHLQQAIADLEAKLQEAERVLRDQERAVGRMRITVNQLYEMMGQPPKYQENGTSTTPPATEVRTPTVAAVRPDEYFGKPLATCVRHALNLLRAAGRAPASVDAIYDVLKRGGYGFESKSAEAAIQGLSVSIGKNSGLFVKLPSGLIGVKEWYGNPPRAGKRKSPDGASEQEGAAAENGANGDSAAGGDAAGQDKDKPPANNNAEDLV